MNVKLINKGFTYFPGIPLEVFREKIDRLAASIYSVTAAIKERNVDKSQCKQRHKYYRKKEMEKRTIEESEESYENIG